MSAASAGYRLVDYDPGLAREVVRAKFPGVAESYVDQAGSALDADAALAGRFAKIVLWDGRPAAVLGGWHLDAADKSDVARMFLFQALELTARAPRLHVHVKRHIQNMMDAERLNFVLVLVPGWELAKGREQTVIRWMAFLGFQLAQAGGDGDWVFFRERT